MFYIIDVLKSLLKIFVKNLLMIPCLRREQTLLVCMLSENLGMSFCYQKFMNLVLLTIEEEQRRYE